MRRVGLTILVVLLWGCAGTPDTPEAVVSAALDAARKGDLDGFLSYYTPASAQDLKRAVAAAEGSGWVPEAPLRLLTPGEVKEVHRDGDLAVVEIRAKEATTPVCLTRTDGGWRLNTDAAISEGDGWTCRPYQPLATRTFGGDHAAEE
jgi:hypothetical protein